MNELDACRTTWVEDEDTQSAVLQQLLCLHPTQLTMEELIREMSGERPAFSERDGVERAVRELGAAAFCTGEKNLSSPPGRRCASAS